MSAEDAGVPNVAGGWRFSGHARRMIAVRGFRLPDVIATCNMPEQTYTANTYGPGRWVYQRGHMGVAVHPASRTVITVLLREYGQWSDSDARRVNGWSA